MWQLILNILNLLGKNWTDRTVGTDGDKLLEKISNTYINYLNRNERGSKHVSGFSSETKTKGRNIQKGKMRDL